MCVYVCLYHDCVNVAFNFMHFQSHCAPVMKTEWKWFSFNPPKNTTPCSRQGKRSAGRTLPGWWWWTDKTCCLTRSLWTVGSATWTCSPRRGSCWGSVSTASAGKIQEVEVGEKEKRFWERSRCVAQRGASPLLLMGWGLSVFSAWLNILDVSRDSDASCLCVYLLRECLRSVIMLSEEPEVACPYRDDTYSCTCSLQEREIRAVSYTNKYSLFSRT